MAATNLATRVAPAAGVAGYYRQPTIGGGWIVFCSEGDLWKVPEAGGEAMRITSHPGDETFPAISPDGKTLAYIASYEGPVEAYTIPLDGGQPTRRTWDGSGRVRGWAPDGRLMVATTAFSGLPEARLALIDLNSGALEQIQLAQADQGSFDGKTLFFTRLSFQGSNTKRYKGGTAQNLWRYAPGDAEAAPLTADYAGTSKNPMWFNGRLYFLSDRSGTMNIWSMDSAGKNLKQETKHDKLDVMTASLGDGKIVYQLGADVMALDLATGVSAVVPITLETDVDQAREHWIKRPAEYLASNHVSPNGDKVVLTARGKMFVAPRKAGRFVEIPTPDTVRVRSAQFMPDGKTVLALSDQSGEVELWTYPANGIGKPEQLTTDGTVLRWEALPSPDGKYIAHRDKNSRLFVLEVATKKNTLVEQNLTGEESSLVWSADSQWLAYVAPAANSFDQVKLYQLSTGKSTVVTSDKFSSGSPAFTPDGKWLYFLSDRHFRTEVGSPWGAYDPEPFFDKMTKVYALALQPGERSPFVPPDELHPETADERPPRGRLGRGAASAPTTAPTSAPTSEPTTRKVNIDVDGIAARLYDVPVPPGNYENLIATDKSIFYLSSSRGAPGQTLMALDFTNDKPEPKVVTSDIRGYEMSMDRKHFLFSKGGAVYVTDAASSPPIELGARSMVDLSHWSLSVNPRDEWRQMFNEAWRLERDYFYDRNMHGVDWKAMREKYRPLLDRVNSRSELADVIAQMVAELSALHTFVYGGDTRPATDDVALAGLGAQLERDPAAGGYTVRKVYLSDPDEPARRSPLARPESEVKAGETITQVNGRDVLAAPAFGELLRQQAGQQVLLKVKSAAGAEREVIVVPEDVGADRDLRYHEWEYTRRLEVEKQSDNQIGYVHLRAMGGTDYDEWAKSFYPVFNRQGLIIDVRHNNGGNIDAWILSRLLRKAWFTWSQRVGQAPSWNMHNAFRGHVTVLCDENTSSDGEAFAEGFKRLGIGKVIGTRTWGGEVWLSSSNYLVDRGIATAAEFGVFGPDGTWLVEGHGVDPDIIVDNLPHETFLGKDAQLQAAIDHLRQLIKEKPIPPIVTPKAPDKALHSP
jgi:tricorn protease